MNCLYCGKELKGRLTKFCSKECKIKYYRENKAYNTLYSRKRTSHGTYLKYKLIIARGGKCECCGYNKNIAALEFHHTDPKLKVFTLDSRSIERHSDEEVIGEFNKCKLLCSNCHAELHHPELAMANIDNIKAMSLGIKRKQLHELFNL